MIAEQSPAVLVGMVFILIGIMILGLMMRYLDNKRELERKYGRRKKCNGWHRGPC